MPIPCHFAEGICERSCKLRLEDMSRSPPNFFIGWRNRLTANRLPAPATRPSTVSRNLGTGFAWLAWTEHDFELNFFLPKQSQWFLDHSEADSFPDRLRKQEILLILLNTNFDYLDESTADFTREGPAGSS